ETPGNGRPNGARRRMRSVHTSADCQPLVVSKRACKLNREASPGEAGLNPCYLRTQMIGDLFDSPWKILIVAVVIIVLFGSRKLPEAARSLGKSMRILKTEVSSMHEDETTPAPAQAVTAAPVPAP